MLSLKWWSLSYGHVFFWVYIAMEWKNGKFLIKWEIWWQWCSYSRIWCITRTFDNTNGHFLKNRSSLRENSPFRFLLLICSFLVTYNCHQTYCKERVYSSSYRLRGAIFAVKWAFYEKNGPGYFWHMLAEILTEK